jgi:membrane-bound serine protease (ClpP class)
LPATSDAKLGPRWTSVLFKLLLRLLAAAAASFASQGPAWAQASPQSSPQPSPPFILLLDVKGAIGPATTEYLARGLDAAAARKAAAVIIRIDTPGGLVSSTREIIQAMLASPVPIITYVAPGGAQAASAGTYIVYASHLAAMAPGTNIGAATVVTLGAPPGSEPDRSPAPRERAPGENAPRDSAPGDGAPAQNTPQEKDKSPSDDAKDSKAGKDDTEKAPPTDASTRKAINDAAAFIRSLANLHGRNAQWADKAVREGVSIPADEAVQEKVVEILAPDMQNLLAQADGRQVNLNGKPATLATRDAAVVAMEPGWRTRFLGVITNPNIAYLLMLLGVYGIIFELMTPGAVFPGVLGAVALVTGLFALNLLPVNYAGVGLVLLGVALMVAEAFTSTLGFLGVAGAVIFALGSLFMFDSAEPAFALSIPVVVTATAVIGLLLAAMLTVSVRAHRRKSASGDSTLIGHTAEVLAWSGEQGRIRLGDEMWDARGAGPYVAGDQVVITARDGLTLTVTAAGAVHQENPS